MHNRNIKINLINSILFDIKKCVELYKKEEDDDILEPYEDVTPYVAYGMGIELTKIENNIKVYNCSIKPIQNKLMSLLTVALTVLTEGPSVIAIDKNPFHDFYFKTSMLANQKAAPMIDDLSKLHEEMLEINHYINRLTHVNVNHQHDKLLLDVEFNQFKKEELELYGINYLDEKYLKAVSIALCSNKHIKELTLAGQQLTDAGIAAIAKCDDNIKCLEIRGDKLTDKSSEILATRQFNVLRISGKNLTDKSAMLLAKNRNITKLVIKSDQITRDGLCELFKNNSINNLSIQSNSISDDDIVALMNSLQSSQIKKLSIISNNISNKSMPALAQVTRLDKLTITSSQLDDQTVQYFSTNTNLSVLNLYGNNEKLTCRGTQFFSYAISGEHPNKKWYKDYLLQLEEDLFLLQIIKTQGIAKLVLEDKELRDKLDKLKVNKNKQTFKHSCTARSIMLLLKKLDILSDDQFTLSKELEIYTQIWKKPGDDADIDRVIVYLHSLNLNAVIYEDKALVDSLINNEALYKQAYDEYQVTKSNLSVKNIDIYNAAWNLGSYFMLVVSGGGSALHIIIAAFENGKYFLFDPSRGVNEEGNSLKELIENGNYLFTGITIQVRPVQLVQTLQNSGAGFFTLPQPELENNQIALKACVIQ